MRELVINSNDAGQRADKFLSKALVGIPQSLLHKYFRKKCVKINGVHAKGTEMLRSGDTLTLYISDEFFPDNTEKSKKHSVLHVLSEEDIAYEDENIIILDKAQGEAVHSSLPDEESKDNEICLVDRLIGYLITKGEYIPENENSFTPALCNRLDRNTSGLVIAAKNAEALRIMNEKIKNREMQKLYHALVYGIPEKKEALLKNVQVKKVKLISDGSVADFGTCAEFDLKIPDEELETEENLSSYTEFFMANKVTEIDLSGATASATSEWEKNPARNILDGNQRVAYHSDPDDKDKFPVVITVDLGDVYTVSEIEYIPRIDDTTKHGIWTDFAVWASLDGEDYVPALENGALEIHLNNQKIKFEKPVKGRYFEFEVNEGYRGYVTCGDLKFFERAADTDERVSEVKEKYVLQIGSNIIKTEMNGVSSEKQIDVAPFIDSGYTQIPLRGLLEEMGASLTWDGERQKIDITGDGIKIEMQIMYDAVYVTNDRLGRVRYTLQTPPQIKDSRTFVPLRFISENLGYNVAWNGETQEITITK